MKIAFALLLLALSAPSTYAASATGKIVCGKSGNLGELVFYFGKTFAVVEKMTVTYGYDKPFTLENYRLEENHLRGWEHYDYNTANAGKVPGPGGYYYSFSVSQRVIDDMYSGDLNVEGKKYFFSVGVGRDYYSSDHIWLNKCVVSWIRN